MRRLLFLLLLSTPALGQQGEDDVGRIGLELDPGAVVQVFPRVDSQRVELAIHGQEGSIRDFFRGRITQGVLDMDAYSTGGGSWLVILYLADPDMELNLVQVGTEWTLEIGMGSPPILESEPAVGPAELLAGNIERDRAPPPATPLHPLDGDALTITFEPRDYRIFIPEWKPTLPVRRPDRELLVWPQEVRLRHIEEFRRVLTRSPLARSRMLAIYRLGQGYMALGLYPEARHYFDRLAETEGEWDPAAVHLFRAQSSLALGRWEEARERCGDALAAGARESNVLECLGIVSLATSSPPPTETGRALAASTGRPEALLLAGQLLQLDHRHREAEALLRTAADNLSGDQRKQALINLGDARFAHGDLEGAREAWRWVGATGELYEVLQLRQKMVEMSEKGPRTWAGAVPELDLASRARDRSGAEAAYLLAQVAEALGDNEGAANHLVFLLEKHGRLVMRSDVAERLWRIVRRRLRMLKRQNRYLEMAVFYRDFYREELRKFVDDTDILGDVTYAFETLGLDDRALQVQVEIFAIQTIQARDDLGAIMHLVELYVGTGRGVEALETIDYARGLAGVADLEGRLKILEGMAREEMDQIEEARAAFLAAAGIQETQVEGAGRLALLDSDAGHCEAAVDGLLGLSQVPPDQYPEDIVEGRVQIALARCLLALGRNEEALVAAREGAGQSDDELHKRYATYIAAVAAQRAGQDGMYVDALESYDDLWAALAREDRDAAEFQREIEARLRP